MKTIQIGTIVNTHGLKGEVKVIASTDFKEERYDSNHSIYIDFNNEFVPVKVKKYRIHKGCDLLTFEGLEDINKVEKYLKCDLYAEDLPIQTLYEGEFHVKDLIGIDVIKAGNKIGFVQNIKTYPQGDYLLVELDDKSTKLIPFRDEFVETVDVENKCVHIAEIDGLL